MIVAADGRKVTSVLALRVGARRARARATWCEIAFGATARRATATIKTVADPQDSKRAIVGVSARDDLTVKLPVRITIDAGGVGGPSAGLAFALDILQELGRNVAHGHKVAATGELALDGTRRRRSAA